MLKNVESQSTFNEVRSSAKTRISRSGYVSCEARNKYGKDSKLVKIDIKGRYSSFFELIVK